MTIYNVSVCATLQFTYVDTYPDDAPVIEVPSYEGMDNSDAENLREFLEQEVIIQPSVSRPPCYQVAQERCLLIDIKNIVFVCGWQGLYMT